MSLGFPEGGGGEGGREGEEGGGEKGRGGGGGRGEKGRGKGEKGRGEGRRREGEKIKVHEKRAIGYGAGICRYTLVCGSISMTPFLLIAIRSTSGNFGSVDCWWRRYRFARTHDQLHLSVSINIHPQRTLTSKKAEPNVA